jgi:hypothetical protein
MSKKADILTLYNTLACPYQIWAQDIMRIFGCSHTTANKIKIEAQNWAAANGYKNIDDRYVTKDMLLGYKGWNWEEIKKEAFDLLKARA